MAFSGIHSLTYTPRARTQEEEKEKLKARVEEAYKKRLAARLDTDGGGGGRARSGSNTSKYTFSGLLAGGEARVVDPAAVTAADQRAIRRTAAGLVAWARRQEARCLRPASRAGDYDGARGAADTVMHAPIATDTVMHTPIAAARAGLGLHQLTTARAAFQARAMHKSPSEVIASGRPTRICSARSALPAVITPGTDAPMDRAMHRSAQLSVAASAVPRNAALATSTVVNHDAAVDALMATVRSRASAAHPQQRRAVRRARSIGTRSARLPPLRLGAPGPGAAGVLPRLWRYVYACAVMCAPKRAPRGCRAPLSRRDSTEQRRRSRGRWNAAAAAAARGTGCRCRTRPRPRECRGALVPGAAVPCRTPVCMCMCACANARAAQRVAPAPAGAGSREATARSSGPRAIKVLTREQEVQQVRHLGMLRLKLKPAEAIARDASASPWAKASAGCAYGQWGYIAAGER